MIDYSVILGFTTVSLAVALAPGPSWICVITATALHGRGSGMAAVAGNGAGILCHAGLAVVGLAFILQVSVVAFFTVKCLGVAYLFWLAYKIVRNKSFVSSVAPRPHRELHRVFCDGLLVNALNPKVSLLMLALLPQFVSAANGSMSFQIMIYGLIHVLVASSVLTCIVMMTSVGKETLGRWRGAERLLRWCSGVLLFAFGVRLALSQQS